MHITLRFIIGMWTKRPFEDLQRLTLVIGRQVLRIRYAPINWVMVAIRSMICYHTLNEMLNAPQTQR